MFLFEDFQSYIMCITIVSQVEKCVIYHHLNFVQNVCVAKTN